MIRILALDSRLSPTQEQALLRRLPESERQLLERFVHAADRHRTLLGRAAARAMIGRALNLSPPDIPLLRGPQGKPEVAAPGCGHVQFSISHSGDWVLLALADQTVGVDIERERSSLDPALIPACFTPREQTHIKTREDFYRYWTYKEAAIKAAGTGFTLDPLQFEVVETTTEARICGDARVNGCRLARLPAPGGYSAAVATLATMPGWTFERHETDMLLDDHADERLFLCNSSH